MAAFTGEDQTDRRVFRRVGGNRDFAPGRGEEIEETILRLDRGRTELRVRVSW